MPKLPDMCPKFPLEIAADLETLESYLKEVFPGNDGAALNPKKNFGS